jgi:hypothetical protein
MPVSGSDVRTGDPTIQASGQYRGTVDVYFDDGRQEPVNIRAADQDAWNDAVAAAESVAQARMEERDANEVVGDHDVAANKEATIAQTCVAYIRRAWQIELAYDAYLLYARIDTYVGNHSDWNTAHTHLLAEGLTQEEYDQAKDAYTYLSGAGRPATMSDARTIQANWESQH